MMKKLILSGALFIGLAFTLNSCQKVIEDARETTVSAEDMTEAQTAMMSAFDVIDDISTTDGRLMKKSGSILPGGAVVEFADSSFTDGDGVEFTVDFGNYDPDNQQYGLLCGDGKTRAGVINVTVSKRYNEVGAVAVATFGNGANAFYVGIPTYMGRVEGKITLSRTGQEAINLKIENGKVTYTDYSIEHYADNDIKRTKGNGDPGADGDEYEMSGNGGGVNRNGEPFTVSITESLFKRVDKDCSRTFIDGNIELTNTNTDKTLKLDFDPKNDRACDNIVRVTLPGGLEQNIEMK